MACCSLKTAVIVVVVLALFPTFINLISRQEYDVHTSGGVLVTGASTGIGQTATFHLASKGFRVYAAVRKEKDMIQFAGNPNIHPIILDVTKQEHIDRAFVQITEDLKKHDNLPFVGLVNNAGISPASKAVEFLSVDNVRYGFEVNVVGVFAVTQKFLPLLRESKGRVINISSLSGLMSTFFQSAYAGTKFALEAFSDSLRMEMLQFGVSVSSVNPGYVHTPILNKLITAVRKDVSAEEEALYGHMIRSYTKSVENNSPGGEFAGYTTDVTDAAILSALTDKYPETNYLVAGADGTPGWVFGRITWVLPKRLFDTVVFGIQG